ncbi:MAG: type II toxin-antitoxin system RelE/ParE family toxin [Thermodesulfobacteriota bacterium]
MRVFYTDRAWQDLALAFGWYEEQHPGLGLDFLNSVESTIKTIEQMPKSYAIHHKNFRRALLRRFPFAFFYTLEDNSVIIHAVFDNRQDPKKMP